MFVITKSSDIVTLQKNQICILCEANEKLPERFAINDRFYIQKLAVVIPFEFTQKNFVKGSIFEHNTCVIFGCDKADSFNKILVHEEKIKEVCKDIWENPDNHSDYKKGSEGAFYQFLKYLYVEFPDGSEKSLYDVANS